MANVLQVYAKRHLAFVVHLKRDNIIFENQFKGVF